MITLKSKIRRSRFFLYTGFGAILYIIFLFQNKDAGVPSQAWLFIAPAFIFGWPFVVILIAMTIIAGMSFMV